MIATTSSQPKVGLEALPATAGKAAIYCRVSTDDQADNGTSLDKQENAARVFAAQHGYTVPDGWVFRDDYTGMEKHRPQMNHLRALITQQRVDAVICYDSSRLARKWMVLVALAEEFEGEDIALHFTEHPTPKTLEEWLLFNVQGYTNEKAREYTRTESMKALRTRAAKGGFKVGRYPSYGLKFKDQPSTLPFGKPTPKWTYELDDQDDGEAVKVMQRIGRSLLEGMSLAGIATELNREGVRTPAQYHWDHGYRSHRATSRPPGAWERGTIYSLLINPVYKGERRSFGTRVEKYRSETRDQVLGERIPKRRVVPNTVAWDPASGRDPLPGEYVVHQVPAIFDPPTWDAIQAVLATNQKENNRRNAIAPEIGDLKGRVYCGYCHQKMYRMTVRRKDRPGGQVTMMYHCHRNLGAHAFTCPGGGLSASIDRLDEDVWHQYVMGRLLSPTNVQRMLEAGEADRQQMHTRVEDQRSRLDTRLATVEAQLSHCMQEVMRPDNSEGLRAMWRVQAQEQERQLRELREERTHLADAETYTQSQLSDLRRMRDLLTFAEGYFANLPREDRRKWYRALGVKVTVFHPDAPSKPCRWEAESRFQRWQALGLEEVGGEVGVSPSGPPSAVLAPVAGATTGALVPLAGARRDRESSVKYWVEYFYVTLEAE